MRKIGFSEAVDSALAQAMVDDPRIVIFGEDVQGLRTGLFIRFGEERVCSAPISEAAFVGAAVAASMAGLRPVVEIMLVDFAGAAMDALLNHAAKIEAFSGGRWKSPLVVRTACGGGYGDGGQHEQSLWGWLAHIPGLAVLVPSTPTDAAGLMLAALDHGGPVVFLEHKLFGGPLLDALGKGGRETVSFEVPEEGASGESQRVWKPVPIGKVAVRREGRDLTLLSLGVGVHRCLAAAQILEQRGISAGVVDLRSVAPLDANTICEEVAKTRRMLVVDEDYERFGLSGELAAIVLEAGISFRYARVCTKSAIPFARHLEDQALPSVQQIVDATEKLIEGKPLPSPNERTEIR